MSFCAQHTATLLPDGMVLVTGATGGNGFLEEAAQVQGVEFAKPAEQYDPCTGTWTATASMSNKQRRAHRDPAAGWQRARGGRLG